MKAVCGKSKRFIAGAVMLSVLLGGCSASPEMSGGNDTKNVRISRYELKSDPDIKADIDFAGVKGADYDKEVMDSGYRKYCISLFSRTVKDYGGDGNVMISPASVMTALDLVAAGAKGESLRQLTDLFAPGQGPLDQQAYAAALMDKINSSKDVDFTCANAVWNNAAKLGDQVNTDYVDYIKDTFLAEYIVTDFGSKTADEINSWIDAKTDHMITNAIDDLSPEAVMVLVNAICFDGEWMDPYEDSAIDEGDFTACDGTVQTVSFLHDTTAAYYETDKATGFIKMYKGGQYAFLAILPKDATVSANEFAAGFTAEDYEDFIGSVSYSYEVISKMPEFESDFDLMMNNTISELGADSIFSPYKADLSGIAKKPGDIYISRILHKTHIEVNRKGTRASAATIIEATMAGDVELSIPEYRYVECNRPFVYAVVDTATMAPVFIGTVNTV